MVPTGSSSSGEIFFMCQSATGVPGRYQASTAACYCGSGGVEVKYTSGFKCLYYQVPSTSKSIRFDYFL